MDSVFVVMEGVGDYDEHAVKVVSVCTELELAHNEMLKRKDALNDEEITINYYWKEEMGKNGLPSIIFDYPTFPRIPEGPRIGPRGVETALLWIEKHDLIKGVK